MSTPTTYKNFPTSFVRTKPKIRKVQLKQRQLTYKENIDSTILTVSEGKLNFYLWNLLVLAGVPFCLIEFNQNPTFFGILIGIFLLIILLFNSVEYLIVENDKLIVLNKSVFFLSFMNRKKIFHFNEIHKVAAVIKINEKAYINHWIWNLTNKIKFTTSNQLEIVMKNGRKNIISMAIFEEKLIPIINFMKTKGVEIETIYPNNKDIL